MKARLLFVLCVLISFSFQAQTWQWAKKAGGVKSDKALDMDLDANGNAYVCGYYNAASAVAFGTVNPTTDFGKEGFIARIDKAGNWVWVRSAIGGWDERILGMCVDKVNGYVYATGTTWDWGQGQNEINFGTCKDTSFGGAYDDIFIGKFDLNGNCQWIVSAGGQKDDQGYDVITDKQGNAYITGYISYCSSQPAVFGSFNVFTGGNDTLGFVAKMNPAGVFQWVQTFGGYDGERDNRVAVDSSSNVYITGGFHGTQPFGSGTMTSINNSRDIFVVKYDKNGNFIWSKQAGGNYDDRGNGITVEASTQKVYITGEFRDVSIFGTDTVNNNGGPGGRDIFVARMNGAGNWHWVKKAGSNSGGERGNSICTNKKGNIYVAGEFCDTAKFGNSITLISSPTATVDAFVAAIDSLGKWKWALKGGSVNEDRGGAIASDDSCNVYTAGYYEGTAFFGSTVLPATGNKDLFVARINNACFNYVLDVDELRGSSLSTVLFPNPADAFIKIRVNDNNFAVEKAELLLMDMLGRQINVSKRNENNDIVVDITSLSPGVYTMNLLYNGKANLMKLVKQ